MFSDRKIYSCDPKTGALEIRSCHLNRALLKFSCKIEAKYSTLPKVFKIFKLKQAVLIYFINEDLGITDTFGIQIKAILRNLFQGNIYQDRSNPNDLYIRNESEKGNGNFKLNLFNNSPCSIPYQILIKSNAVSLYDHNDYKITYFESVENLSDAAALSFISLRMSYDSFLDFENTWIMPEVEEGADQEAG